MTEKIDEETHIIIREPEEDMEEEYEVKELFYSLKTIQSNESSVETEVINGELETVIISSNKRVSVNIRLAEHPEIVLFEVVDFEGTKYLPLRSRVYDVDGNPFTFDVCNWYLNDSLLISIKGQVDTQVDFKLRYC
jgi:hypothetical protein